MASAGTGLGLSIVQRLVDMHEGKLWAESDGIGCGSTFYVQLKLAAETSEVLGFGSQTSADLRVLKELGVCPQLGRQDYGKNTYR